MHFTSLLVAFAAGSAFTQAMVVSRRFNQTVGVGFSLNTDYAVAAVVYSDGSTVDVIKIEGSSTYQNVMKTAGGDTRQRSILYQNSQRPIYAQDTLSERLGRVFTTAQPDLGLVDMFVALKTSVEAFLGQPISMVDVAIPFPLSSRLEASIRLAYDATKLEYAHPPASAPELAAKYEKLTEQYPESSGGDLILAVDWNRAAFTLTVLEANRGSISTRRVEHDEDLGDIAMKRCLEQSGQDSCDEYFVAFIHKAVQPLRNEEGNLKRIQRMLLVGEFSMSTKIMYHVKDELMKQFDEDTRGDTEAGFHQRIHSVSPVFAAARAAGAEVWKHIARLRVAQPKTKRGKAALIGMRMNQKAPRKIVV